MMKTFEEHFMSLPSERRARIESRAEELITSLRLEGVRKKRRISQKMLAGRMNVTQPAISQMEHDGIMSLPTLRRFAEALGAKLDILLEFPDGEMYKICPDLKDTSDDAPELSSATRVASPNRS